MTAKEFVRDMCARLECGGALDPVLGLLMMHNLTLYLQRNLRVMKLENGAEIHSLGDLRLLLEEIGEAADSTKRALAERPHWRTYREKPPHFDDCPDCGHTHLDDKVCNFPISFNRFCLCERRKSL